VTPAPTSSLLNSLLAVEADDRIGHAIQRKKSPGSYLVVPGEPQHALREIFSHLAHRNWTSIRQRRVDKAPANCAPLIHFSLARDDDISKQYEA
jgi:hypothetical protein